MPVTRFRGTGKYHCVSASMPQFLFTFMSSSTKDCNYLTLALLQGSEGVSLVILANSSLQPPELPVQAAWIVGGSKACSSGSIVFVPCVFEAEYATSCCCLVSLVNIEEEYSSPSALVAAAPEASPFLTPER
jgi:hypothetical protein